LVSYLKGINLWSILKRKIFEYYPEFLQADERDETKEHLIDAAQEVWSDLADELLATLSDTMENRVQRVKDANGWYKKSTSITTR
jgi:hypothetical protein